jgi:acyl carrier protein
MLTEKEVKAIVINEVEIICKQIDSRIKIEEDMELYGAGGVLDSISVMELLVNIEETLRDNFNISVNFLEDSMFSAYRSPVKNIPNLINTIIKMIKKEDK